MNFFAELSQEINLPVRNLEFLSDISPPYGVYQVTEERAITADSVVVYSEKFVDFALYHKKTDLKTEKILDTYLNDRKIAYEKTNAWIEQEKLVETTYQLIFNKMEEL